MKALVVAGGVPQIELIKQLQQRGFYTILVDGSSTCVARPYADSFYQINVFDIDAVKGIAEQERVDLVITVCADQVLLVVVEVSELLGLPCYIGLETGKNVSDKLRMKSIFKESGVPTTDYVEAIEFDIADYSHLKYPLVVKPVDAYSSRGVRKCNNASELRAYYEEASQISRSGRVIVEEYFEGEEISVDAFVVDGKAQVLAITNSDKIRSNDRFVIFRGRYPSKVSDVVIGKINDIAQRIANAFHLNNAPLLIQILVNGSDVSVLEFCARTGGNMKYLLIKHSCGVDVIRATIDITLGITPDLTPRDAFNVVVVNDFIYCQPGILDHFEGFDKMVETGFINEFHPSRSQGWEVRGVTSSSDRVAGMNIIAGSTAEYNEKLHTILSSVKVIDIDGNDIMRRDLLPDLV